MPGVYAIQASAPRPCGADVGAAVVYLRPVFRLSQKTPVARIPTTASTQPPAARPVTRRIRETVDELQTSMAAWHARADMQTVASQRFLADLRAEVRGRSAEISGLVTEVEQEFARTMARIEDLELSQHNLTVRINSLVGHQTSAIRASAASTQSVGEELRVMIMELHAELLRALTQSTTCLENSMSRLEATVTRSMATRASGSASRNP